MSVFIAALVALAFAVGAYLVNWLSNRPDGSHSTTEEIRDELRQSFRPRDELEFMTLIEHFDPVLDVLANRFSGGFEQRHLEMLRFRIETQTPGLERSATYAVIWEGAESDLVLEWIVKRRERIQVRITAPGGSLEPVRDSVVHSPGRIFSESLTWVA